MSSHPEENRPIPKQRKAEKPRKISKTEERRQKFQYWVTVFLAVVFIGSSVGVLILARPPRTTTEAEKTSAEDTRLTTAREQALKNPKDPQWPYEAAEILIARGDTAGALVQYKAALAADPGYLPALQKASSLLITDKNYKDARKVLVDGIAAEKTDVEALNKARKPDEPEVFPDASLRMLLFVVDMQLGASNEDEAKRSLREAIRLNPTVFTQLVQGWAMRAALETGNKTLANQGLDLAIAEARQANEKAAVDTLTQVKQMIASLGKAPSGAPMVVTPGSVNASKSTAPAADASAAPAAPAADASAAPAAPAADASAAPAAPAADASAAPAAPASTSP